MTSHCQSGVCERCEDTVSTMAPCSRCDVCTQNSCNTIGLLRQRCEDHTAQSQLALAVPHLCYIWLDSMHFSNGTNTYSHLLIHGQASLLSHLRICNIKLSSSTEFRYQSLESGKRRSGAGLALTGWSTRKYMVRDTNCGTQYLLFLTLDMDSRLMFGITAGLATVILLRLLARTFTKNSSRYRLPFPPGPKPLPLIGNVLDIPHDKEWFVYHQLAQQYGAYLPSRRCKSTEQ